ncbi:hypothetical protein AB0O01_02500 [Streptomyces sp. NPDC093252]|uniref:hypothetical protein n=1 Tax=Streptomyces sp. NPDC093252 TaxID=3154980 RepID=UPI0034366424
MNGTDGTAPEDPDDWRSPVLFARALSPTDLAARLGADLSTAREGVVEEEVELLLGEWYRPGGSRDGLIRVGERDGWAFAVEYGGIRGRARLAEASRDGGEAVRYEPPGADPATEPADFSHARDGTVLYGYGLTAEHRRYGTRRALRDLPVPDLVAAGLLTPDGGTRIPPPDGRYGTAWRQSVDFLERRFGLTLSASAFRDLALTAYPVRAPAQGP